MPDPSPAQIAEATAAIVARRLAARRAEPGPFHRGSSVRLAKLLGGLAVVRRKRIFDFARLERDGEE